ncbi:MAG: hypothetical protein M1828_005785 [Chrysothrix sp. TS-e1954]|nr:MAG: hypothetical protein M1828_005785 [Chrysothrix sp. TS-e1954]
MFKRSFASSKDRMGMGKSSVTRVSKKQVASSMREKAKLAERMNSESVQKSIPQLTSAIITVIVGRDQRLFAAHEDVLSRSPYFKSLLKTLYFTDTPTKRLDFTFEEPEIFSAILEYLYKGDYYPRLLHDKRRGVFHLEGVTEVSSPASPLTVKSSRTGAAPAPSVQATLFHAGEGATILRDTAIYCAADRYGLEELKRLALRKQGLQASIEVSTILRSMRYAYTNTPHTDSRLRAHYLALIVRSRRTFKRSGTMQNEMERGGPMFFDLFVAMCNHLDDVAAGAANTSPRTV